MHRLSVFLACLLCTSHGRQRSGSLWKRPDSYTSAQHQVVPLQVLARLLRAAYSADAFNPSSSHGRRFAQPFSHLQARVSTRTSSVRSLEEADGEDSFDYDEARRKLERMFDNTTTARASRNETRSPDKISSKSKTVERSPDKISSKSKTVDRRTTSGPVVDPTVFRFAPKDSKPVRPGGSKSGEENFKDDFDDGLSEASQLAQQAGGLALFGLTFWVNIRGMQYIFPLFFGLFAVLVYVGGFGGAPDHIGPWQIPSSPKPVARNPYSRIDDAEAYLLKVQQKMGTVFPPDDGLD